MGLFDIFGGKDKSPHELLNAGKHKQALEGFLKLHKKKRSDPQLMNQIADLYKKLKNNKKALEFYIKTGDHYGGRGFFNKSVAAFKKALSISPENKDVLTKLAEYNDQVPKYMIDARILEQIRALKGDQSGSEEGTTGEEPAQVEPVDMTLDAQALESVEPLDAMALPAEVSPEPQEGAEPTDVDLPQPLPSAEASPEAIEVVPKDSQLPKSEPQEIEHFVSHSGIELTADDLEEQIEIQPSELWDESIKFEDSTMEPRPEEPAKPAPLGDVESSIWEKDIFSDEAVPSTTALPDEPQAKEPVSQEAEKKAILAKESAVFKISSTDEAKPTVDADQPNFSSFDDAIDSIFQPTSPKADEESRREINKKHWPIFRTLPSDVVMDLIVAMKERTYSAGSTIVNQGEEGSEMFLITDGTVDVAVTTNGAQTKVAELESGDFFGEAALLTKRPRNATVVARTETEVLILAKGQFLSLVKQHPTVLEAIQTVNLARLQQNASRFR